MLIFKLRMVDDDHSWSVLSDTGLACLYVDNFKVTFISLAGMTVIGEMIDSEDEQNQELTAFSVLRNCPCWEHSYGWLSIRSFCTTIV